MIKRCTMLCRRGGKREREKGREGLGHQGERPCFLGYLQRGCVNHVKIYSLSVFPPFFLHSLLAKEHMVNVTSNHFSQYLIIIPSYSCVINTCVSWTKNLWSQITHITRSERYFDSTFYPTQLWQAID